MGWFTKDKKSKCIVHNWRITEALQITRHHDTPAYLVPESHETQVSRICKYCLKQELHTVKGHISKEEAIEIYGGPFS